ncbi:hypothetical protein Avbf_16916 [Armadillidium vulgare]|nr:hypothetical protein Avbf_16916 [Armadillidium vulgare]
MFLTDIFKRLFSARHFLTRALLSAESMVEAQNILRDRGVGSADAFSTKQEGDHMFHNAEVGPAEDCLESPLSVLTISPGEFFVHTNTDGNTKEDKIKTIAIGLFDILERKWTLWN